MAVAINDRTAEFRHIVTAAKRRQTTKPGSQRLLGDSQNNGEAQPRRSEFARQAAEIGRGISATMGKLEKLAQRRWHSTPKSWGKYLAVRSGQEEDSLRRQAG
jgi:syntaxin 5